LPTISPANFFRKAAASSNNQSRNTSDFFFFYGGVGKFAARFCLMVKNKAAFFVFENVNRLFERWSVLKI